MMVKCPKFINLVKSCGPCDGYDQDCYADVIIPTADLIAELDKRRPCGKCEHDTDKGRDCLLCFWNTSVSLSVRHDNFKEATK